MHTEYTALMSLVLDREATPQQVAGLQAHLAGCAACARTWQDWQGFHAKLSAAPMLIAPPAFALGVTARLETRRRQQRRRRWLASGLLVTWGGMLCALWILALVLCWWGYVHPVELSLALSSAAQVLSGTALLLRGLERTLGGFGGPSPVLWLCSLAGFTAALVLVWVWAMARSAGWRGLSGGAAVSNGGGEVRDAAT
jgi:hypothetical protein